MRNQVKLTPPGKKVIIAIALCATLSVLLTGCGLGTSAGAGSGLGTPKAEEIAGQAMGGNGPIGGATVKIYLVGTSGYGQGNTTAIATATTKTDGTGSFAFTAGNYTGTCTAGALAYIELTGGDPTGGTNTSNSFISMVAPLGTCGSLNSYTVINEATTVATMFAAAQYFNAATGTFGSPATTQAQLGLSNAFALSALLVPTISAEINTSFTPSSSVTGVTMTATPESGKLGAIADVLASCVNLSAAAITASPTANSCNDLINAATPTLLPATTSGSTSTFSQAANTLTAAYYMAINPMNSGSFTGSTLSGTSGTVGSVTNCSAAGGTTSTPVSVANNVCLYDLIAAAGAPFTSSLSAAPLDWTLGITYTSGGTCPVGGSFIKGPYKSAIDANGNLWFINGVATSGANLSEMSPLGTALTCLGNNGTGRGLTIDTNGNVWASFDVTAGLATDIQELPVGGSALTAWPITGNPSYYMAADGLGNVFYQKNGDDSINEFVNAAASPAPFPSVAVYTGGTAVTFSGMAIDPSNRIWTTLGTSSITGSYPGVEPSAAITGFTITSNVVSFTTTGSTLVAGNAATITGLTTGTYLNGQSLTVLASPTPTATSFSANFTYASNVSQTTDTGTAVAAATFTTGSPAAGLGNTYGMASDAAGHLFNGTTCCSGTTANRFMQKYTPSATAASSTAAPVASVQNAGGINGVRGVAVDGAGNVWVGNEYPGSGLSTTSTLYGVAELTNSLVAISPLTTPATCSTTAPAQCPTGGYIHQGIGYGLEVISIDIAGNVWIPNVGYNGTTPGLESGVDIEEIIGAAVPVVTPIAVAIKNGTLATKP